MPTGPTIAVHLHADVVQAVDGFTDAIMHALSPETGLPASVWREAHDLAGDEELFKQAVQAWREHNPGGETPAGIVRTLLAVRAAPALDAPTIALRDEIDRLAGERNDAVRERDLREARTRKLLGEKSGRRTADLTPDESRCAKCLTLFACTAQRNDPHRRYLGTAYCRNCVDLCHDNETADHRCVICAPGVRA